MKSMEMAEGGPRPIAVRAIAWMFALMAAICALFLLRAAVSAGDQVPYAFDNNEGWNAYHAQAAMAGGVLYPSPPSFMVNNYPPLSFYIVGLFGKPMGGPLEAGRILSIVAFVLTGLGIAAAARRMGCSRLEAGWGAGLFMAMLLMDYDYVGMNDPQMLGHAFAMAGLCLALQERSLPRLLASALAFSVAFFIKQNLCILPLAVVLWLFLYDRRSGIRLALAGAAIFLAGCGAFQLAYGKSLWSQLNAPRSYDPADSLKGLLGWLELGAVPAVAAFLLPAWFPRDRHIVFCLIYLGLSLAAGTAFYGGADVAGNVFFDAQIALSLCAALGVNRFFAGRRGKSALAFALCHFLPLMGGLAYLTATDSIHPRYWLEPQAPARLQAARDIAFLKAQDGRVMCSLLSLCYWAGKPPEIDTAMTGQALLTGRRDGGEIVRLLAEERFSAIQLLPGPSLAYMSRGAIGGAIAAHYRLDHADMYGQFYRRAAKGQGH